MYYTPLSALYTATSASDSEYPTRNTLGVSTVSKYDLTFLMSHCTEMEVTLYSNQWSI